MLFPSRYLVKNCRRCGKNVRIDKDDSQDTVRMIDEEFHCPYCDTYMGRLVKNKDSRAVDVAIES